MLGQSRRDAARERKRVAFEGVDDETVDAPGSSDVAVPRSKRDEENKGEGGEFAEVLDIDEKVQHSEKDHRFDTPDEFPVEPFNMKSERSLGQFDENTGDFVWRRRDLDNDKVRDAWLDEVDQREKDGDAFANSGKRAEASATTRTDLSEEQCFQLVYDVLLDGETPAQAFKRLLSKTEHVPDAAKVRQAFSLGRSHRKLMQNKLQAPKPLTEAQIAENRKVYDKLNEAVSLLIAEGRVEVREMTKRMIRGEIGEIPTHNHQDKRPRPVPSKLWEYKLQNGDVHGPFTSEQMRGWKLQGFFSGSPPVHVRESVKEVPTAPQKPAKSMSDELMNDLDSDDDSDDDQATKKRKTANGVVPSIEREWVPAQEVNFDG